MPAFKHRRKRPAPQKPPLTHFLCLPLITSSSRPQLEASLSKFREDVSPKEAEGSAAFENSDRETTLPIVPGKAIRSVDSLHCTLGVMSLDQNKLSEATECLKSIDVRALLEEASASSKSAQQHSMAGPSSLEESTKSPASKSPTLAVTVDLKGLVSMHDPAKTSILYIAPEDDTGRLYPFCFALQRLFKDRGYLVEDNRPLKMHATIVNTIYAKERKRPPRRNPHEGSSDVQRAGASDSQNDRSYGHGPNANAPLKIDATAILQSYKDYVWAERVVLDRVVICEMGAKKILDFHGKVIGEVYAEVATLPLLS